MTLKENSRIPWNAEVGQRFHVAKVGLEGPAETFEGVITEIPAHRRFAVVTYGKGVRECWPMTQAPDAWTEPPSYMERLGEAPPPREMDKSYPKWQGKLKTLRSRYGLTQQEVSERAGIHISTYCAWERGNRPASVKPMLKVFPELIREEK